MIGGFSILRNFIGLKRKLYIDIPVSYKISSVEQYLRLSYPNMVYHFLPWSQNVGGGEEHHVHYEYYPSSFYIYPFEDCKDLDYKLKIMQRQKIVVFLLE